MEWIPNAIREIGLIFTAYGLGGVVVMVAAGLVAFAFYLNRKQGIPKPMGTPVRPLPLCAAADLEEKLHQIATENAVAIERQAQIRQDLDAVKTGVSILLDRTNRK